MEASEYSLSAGEECFGYMETSTSRSKKKKIVKRRFSDEQIRSLEGVFENETRLEPRKKVEVANKLGLEPRQVAIWFQNKRARYKSKQLEQDYNLLRAKYNDLASRFENLNKDKQALLIQLQKLNNLMQKSKGEGLGQCCRQVNSIDDESDNRDADKLEFEEMIRSEQGIGIDDDSKKAEYFGVEEDTNLVELVEAADSSLTISSAEDWSNFDFNQSSTSYQWWDFWS